MSKRVLAAVAALAIMIGCTARARPEDGIVTRALTYFNNGVIAYESGDYDRAITENEKALGTGLESGSLYYNLGNSYLKKGEIGKAILNYERAKDLIPRDSGLIVNYRLSLAARKQRDAAGKTHPLISELYRTFDYLTLKESVLLFAVFAYLFAVFFTLSKFARRYRPLHYITAVLFLSLVTATAIPLSHKIYNAKRGMIVIAPITDAKLAPTDESSVNFPLYEGMKAYRLKTSKGWCKIKRPDGKIGWVKEGSVALITP